MRSNVSTDLFHFVQHPLIALIKLCINSDNLVKRKSTNYYQLLTTGLIKQRIVSFPTFLFGFKDSVTWRKRCRLLIVLTTTKQQKLPFLWDELSFFSATR